MLAGGFPVQQVDRHFSQQSADSRGVADSHERLVFAEDDAQSPVQTVFDGPMGSDGTAEFCHVVLQTGNVVLRQTEKVR